MTKIKTGTQVKIVKGRDAGKTGEVTKVIYGKTRSGTAANKIIVKGINIVKKHIKPNAQLNIVGGIIEIEKSISISNVRLIEVAKKEQKTTKKTETKVDVTE